jgi:transcriptional regulator with XRE-family HTH domain
MESNIPTVQSVQELLRSMSLKQMAALAEKSGVSMPTLSKIRYGQTENPGIDTVRKLLAHI